MKIAYSSLFLGTAYHFALEACFAEKMVKELLQRLTVVFRCWFVLDHQKYTDNFRNQYPKHHCC